MAPAHIYQRMSEFVMGIKSSSSANTVLPRDYLVRYEDPQANYHIHIEVSSNQAVSEKRDERSTKLE